MGNCGLCPLGHMTSEKDGDNGGHRSDRSTRQNTPVSDGDKNSYYKYEIDGSDTKKRMPIPKKSLKNKSPKLAETSQLGPQLTHHVSLSLRNMALSIAQPRIFFSSLKHCLPATSFKKNFMKLQRQCPQAMPYVCSATLGFARLSRNWKIFKAARRPCVRGGFVKNKAGDRQEIQKITPEKENWWRYTMFMVVDPVDYKIDPKELRITGGKLVSVEGRTGCEIRIDENTFLFRGKEIRHVFIDGPTQNAVICCQKALPDNLQKQLILDHENHFTKEPSSNVSMPITIGNNSKPILKEKNLIKFERLGGIGLKLNSFGPIHT